MEQTAECLATEPVDVSENDRDDRGYFQAEHDDQEYSAAVAERDPAGTAETADAVGVTRRNVDQRLRRLQDDGRINCERISTSLLRTPDEGRETVQHADPDDAFRDAETYAGDETNATDIDDVLYG